MHACFARSQQPRPPKWLLSSRALRVWASSPPTPPLAPEWPLTSPFSFVVWSGAAVCPGRGEATQERRRVYPRLRLRRSLQASPMPPVHWVLLVRAGGHRAANPRDLYQVGGKITTRVYLWHGDPIQNIQWLNTIFSILVSFLCGYRSCLKLYPSVFLWKAKFQSHVG